MHKETRVRVLSYEPSSLSCLTHVLAFNMPTRNHPLIKLPDADSVTNSQKEWQTTEILIEWLLKKQSDQGLYCLEGRTYPGSATHGLMYF